MGMGSKWLLAIVKSFKTLGEEVEVIKGGFMSGSNQSRFYVNDLKVKSCGPEGYF
jgi:hypothetical protein